MPLIPNPSDFPGIGNLIDSGKRKLGELTSTDKSRYGNIDDFRSYFAKGGDFSKTDFFDVLIDVPVDIQEQIGLKGEDLIMQCEATELPGKSVETLTVRHNMFLDRLPLDVVYPDITLNFLCRGDLLEKKLFDVWLEKMVGTKDNHVNYGVVQYKLSDNPDVSNYFGRVNIRQYYNFNASDPVVSDIRLVDAMPIQVASMPLSWSDDGIHKLMVTFTYRKWEDTTIDFGNNFQTVSASTQSGLPGPSILDKVRTVSSVANAAKVLGKRYF